MGHITDKIRALMEERTMSSAKLAQLSGISEATISRYLSGKIGDPRYASLVKIADALAVPVEELAKCGEYKAKSRPTTAPGPEVPVIDGIDFGKDGVTDPLYWVRLPYLPKLSYEELDTLKAMRVSDTAMSPYYLPGDLVFFGTAGFEEPPHLEENSYAACIMNGRCVIRKIEYGDGDDLWLSTTNPEWKGRHAVQVDESVTLLGLVLCSVRGIPAPLFR